MNQTKLTEIITAGALGDAFGYAIEFDSWVSIQRKYGSDGLDAWPYDARSSTLLVSDDTQMTLFALEAIADAVMVEGSKTTLSHITQASQKKFLQWLETQGPQAPKARLDLMRGIMRYESLWQRRAPGNTCLSALSHIRQSRSIRNDSKGCGAVMRAAPYAFLAERFGMDYAWQAASAQGLITHHHADGHLSGAALVHIIASSPKTQDDLVFAAQEAANKAEGQGGYGTAYRLRQACELRDYVLTPEQLCDALGEGWVGDEALGIALWAALKTSNTFEAIKIAANHRGDSDSTASIAGQLGSLLWGLTIDDQQAGRRLDVLTPLLSSCGSAAEALCASSPEAPAASGHESASNF
jgi:ADP-ribosyl-[dinitrogen reductase] hydrolase